MKGASDKGIRKSNQMLKGLQHDSRVGPPFLSSRTCFGISVLVLKACGFKAPPCGRGSLFSKQSLLNLSHLINHMADSKKIPNREECLKMMGQCGVLAHIVDHCLKVAKVAGFLAVELNKKGQRIDLRLVEAASLLHDLTKAEGLRTKEDHAKTGFQLLKGMGYERVGEVVSQHIHLSEKTDPSQVSEEEVVNYADKRVRHDRIVSLRERFVDLKERYGKSQRSFERLNDLEKGTFELEEKIFSILEIHPADLQSL